MSSRTKKIIGIVVLLALFAAGWFNRQRLFPNSEANPAKNLYAGKITIGTETWPGYLPLYVAKDQGYFKEAGLDVEIKIYTGLGELSKDYVHGKMQGRANLTLDALNEHLGGLDHKIVLAIDYSNGSDAILARQGIKTVKDFKGKRVGYEPGTLEEFFVSWALIQNGLSLSDITPVSGNPEETIELLKLGKVDVAVSHEPFLSQVISSGSFHKVYSSADAPGLITDVLTFRTDFIERYPETVEVIVDAYFRGLNFWKTNPQEAYVILSKHFGDRPGNLEKQFNGITMLDERENRSAFTFAAGLQSLYGNMRKIGEFVSEHQSRKPRDLDTDKLIERRFIKKLEEKSGRAGL